MNKLLILLSVLLFTCAERMIPIKPSSEITPFQLNAHWVYVELEDKVLISPIDTKGRSKRGDVIQTLPVTKQFIPSPLEQQAYAIKKVIGLTDKDIFDLTQSWDDTVISKNDTTITYQAYRKKEINLSKFSCIKGLDTTSISRDSLFNNISDKTHTQLGRYERKRLIYEYAYHRINKFFDWAIPKAYAAEHIMTVNKTGEDYNTIVLWEAGEDGAMTDGTDEVCEVYDDDGILKNSTRVDINGWSNNDPNTRIIIRPATGEQHTGTDSTGFQRENTGTSQSIITREAYIIIEGLDINNGSSSGRAIWLYANPDTIVIKNNLVWGGPGAGLQVGTGDSIVVVNNVFYNLPTGDAGVKFDDGNGNRFLNNTVYNCRVGIKVFTQTGDSLVVSNNAFFNNASIDMFDMDEVRSIGVPSTNNCTSDASGDDNNLSGGIINKTDIDNFTSPSTADFSVKDNSADIYDAGADLSGIFTDDVIGTSRPQSSAFDIGAFELIVAAAANPGTKKKRAPIFWNYKKEIDNFGLNVNDLWQEEIDKIVIYRKQTLR